MNATQPSSCQWHTPRTVTVAHCDVMVRTPTGDATVAEKTARVLASCQAVGVSFFVLDLGRLRAPTPHMQVTSLTLYSFLFFRHTHTHAWHHVACKNRNCTNRAFNLDSLDENVIHIGVEFDAKRPIVFDLGRVALQIFVRDDASGSAGCLDADQ